RILCGASPGRALGDEFRYALAGEPPQLGVAVSRSNAAAVGLVARRAFAERAGSGDLLCSWRLLSAAARARAGRLARWIGAHSPQFPGHRLGSDYDGRVDVDARYAA